MQNVKNTDEKHSLQSRRLVMMGWEDMADMNQNPSRNCPSLSTEMKPSGGCFSDEKHSVQSGRLVITRWEDMADQSSLPTKFRLSFSTGALKHPPDGFIGFIVLLYILGASECSNSSSYSANFPCQRIGVRRSAETIDSVTFP